MALDGLSILVDENIPYALETFGRLGTVRTLPGRRITTADVRNTDVLIVRSVTRVDEPLLSGSPVRFVGTATIGCDHVDVPYLQARGIEFASAPGSNANSVSEYIVAALLRSAEARRASLEGSTLAVIGVGNVGSRVVEQARALGIHCVLNDPPRQRTTNDAALVSLEEAISCADSVTLHVPLETRGPEATSGMAGRTFFDRMRPGAVFLNTSRGEVVDEGALAAAVDSGRVLHAILDVWRGEPAIEASLVRRAFLATPHIAGYSFDGKVTATMMLFNAVCGWLNRPADVDLTGVLPPPSVPQVDLSACRGSDEDLLRAAVGAVCEIEEDDRALRRAMMHDAPAARFDLLRKTYRQRREFHQTTVIVPRGRETLLRKVTCLGFRAMTE